MIKWLIGWLLELLPFEFLLGAGVALVLPLVLVFLACGIRDGGCPSGVEVTLVMGMAALWGLAVWLWRRLPRRRWFVLGMAATLAVALWFPTGRTVALMWTLPVTGPLEFAREAAKRGRRAAHLKERRTTWLEARRGKPLSRAAGIRTATNADRCILQARRFYLTPFTAGEALQKSDCGIFVAGKEDTLFTRDGRWGQYDAGWRWSVPDPAGGYPVRVLAEPALGVAAPVFQVDSLGVVVERDTDGAPARVVFDAVAILRELYPCVRQSRIDTRAGWTFEAVTVACPGLRGRLQGRINSFGERPHEATLHVYGDEQMVDASRVAMFLLELRPLLVGFELEAGLQVDYNDRPHRRYIVGAGGVRQVEP